MSDFSSPGDGLFKSESLSSITSSTDQDRLYPTLYGSDDDEDEFGSDTSSSVAIRVGSTPSPTGSDRSVDRKYLFPKQEFVDLPRPEEIRWFHKQDGEKKWTAFIGYDSLRIECRYRALMLFNNDTENLEAKQSGITDRILVRGGLYEVDVSDRRCYPVYWSGELGQVLRCRVT
jgi:hypothetical protein